MKKIIFILGLSFSLATYAEIIDVGPIQIEIEPPKGMLKVVPEMGELFDYIQEVNKVKNQTTWVISSYIHPKDVEDIQNKTGNPEKYVRLCSINIPRVIINNNVTKENFNNTVKEMKEFLGENTKKQSELIKDSIEEDKRLINMSGDNIKGMDKSINNIEVLQNTSNSNILLGRIYSEVIYDNNKVEISDVSSGFSTIYLKNKIFMINCQSLGRQEEWLKTEIQEWTNDIINKNKLSFLEEIYYTGSNLGGINWWSVLAAGVIGGLFMPLVRIFTRKRQ